jgi:phosphoserine phosphatase RsbU/P
MKIDNIKRVPLFSELPDSEIVHLAASLQMIERPPGTVILEEGLSTHSCYILLEGAVEIIKAWGTMDERILAVRPEGALLGEMSLFSKGRKHTASVRTLTDVVLLEMNEVDLENLIKRQPQVAYKMVDLLSKRLEESENITIADLREKNRQLTLAYQELQAAQAQMIEKERLERELEIARQIQNSILLQEMPVVPGYSLGALMFPARAVGGDFYDFIPLENGKWGIVIGDVSDKGTPAALFMALSYSLLRAIARRYDHPAGILKEVNTLLNEMNSSGMFVTLVFGILDPESGEFFFARAGHTHPLVLDGYGECQSVKIQTGQPLGLFDEPLLDVQSVILQPGGIILLYSDGLSEAENPEGEIYDEDRLKFFIREQPAQTAQSLCGEIWRDVKSFIGEAVQQDDFTVVAVSRQAAYKSEKQRSMSG